MIILFFCLITIKKCANYKLKTYENTNPITNEEETFIFRKIEDLQFIDTFNKYILSSYNSERYNITFSETQISDFEKYIYVALKYHDITTDCFDENLRLKQEFKFSKRDTNEKMHKQRLALSLFSADLLIFEYIRKPQLTEKQYNQLRTFYAIKKKDIMELWAKLNFMGELKIVTFFNN